MGDRAEAADSAEGAATAGGVSRAAQRTQNLLVALLFLGTLINYVDRQILALLKPDIEGAYGWGDAEFAYFAEMSQYAAALALLVVGWLVDRFGVRLAYGAAVAFWSVAGIAHAFAATVTQFVSARVALIAAEAINTPAVVKSASTYLPLARRTTALGIINTAPNIGNILAPLIVVPFAALYGWQSAFIVTGLLGFVWLALWIISTRRLASLSPAAPAAARRRVDWGALLRDRATWAIAGAKAITDMFWWFFTFWLPDLFTKVFALDQGERAGPTALAFALAAVGALTGGFLFPALLKRGWTINAARKGTLLLFALVIVPIPLALTAGGPWLAAVIIGLGLFAHQGFATNLFGLAADAIPAARVATAIAIGAIAGNLAGAAIQRVTGILLTSGTGYGPLFFAAAGAYLIALAWVHLMLPTIRPAQD